MISLIFLINLISLILVCVYLVQIVIAIGDVFDNKITCRKQFYNRLKPWFIFILLKNKLKTLPYNEKE
jgi:hypothetical protein